jgi:two-component system sensor histidine kinase SenX3
MLKSAGKLKSVWTLAVFLLLLLPLLAVLQYRWLDRLSDWERERTRYILRTATENFRGEFDMRIEPIYRTFQLLFAPRDSKDLHNQFRAACDKIMEKVGSELHLIVADVYWVSPRGSEQALYRYDIDTDSVTAMTWPPPDALLQAIETLPAVPPAPTNRIPALLVEGSPVLAIPNSSSGEPGALAWVLVALDGDYLGETLFPAMFDRHFGGEEAPRFDVAVIAEATPPTARYSSRAGLAPPVFNTCDAQADLFQLEQAFLVVAQPPPKEDGQAPPAQEVEPARESLSSDGLMTPAVSETPGLPPPQVETASLGVNWSLRVRHVEGSVEGAVVAARRRNLIIAFTILALLGVSVSLLVVATQRARRLARMRLAFISGVSHELRSPLAVITSAGENLADQVVDTPERARAYGELIRREGRRLQGMVDRVIRFARYQSGTAEYEFSPQELVPALQAACDACAPELEDNDCVLECSFSEELPRVEIDADAIATAVSNLIGNAIKHGGRGKRIEVAARVSDLKGRAEVEIEVRDFGPGIAEEELRSVFEPFRRTAATREAQVPGSGLGLSLVSEIARAHGGRCEARNLEGGGCLFSLYIPPLGRDPGRPGRNGPGGRETL